MRGRCADDADREPISVGDDLPKEDRHFRNDLAADLDDPHVPEIRLVEHQRIIAADVLPGSRPEHEVDEGDQLAELSLPARSRTLHTNVLSRWMPGTEPAAGGSRFRR